MNILDEAPSPSPSDLCLLLSLFSDHYAANNKTFRGRADFDSGDDLTLLNIYNAYVSRSGVAHHSQRAVWRERDPVGIAAYEDTPDDFVVTGVDDGDIIGGLGCQPELFSVWCHTQPMSVFPSSANLGSPRAMRSTTCFLATSIMRAPFSQRIV